MRGCWVTAKKSGNATLWDFCSCCVQATKAAYAKLFGWVTRLPRPLSAFGFFRAGPSSESLLCLSSRCRAASYLILEDLGESNRRYGLDISWKSEFSSMLRKTRKEATLPSFRPSPPQLGKSPSQKRIALFKLESSSTNVLLRVFPASMLIPSDYLI